MNPFVWDIHALKNVQNSNQNQLNRINDLVQEILATTFRNQESQDHSLADFSQNYIALNSSNNYGDIEALQQSRCEATQKYSEFIQSSNKPTINPKNNLSSMRNKYVPNDQSRQNKIINNQKVSKPFVASGRKKSKPYDRTNCNKDHKNNRNGWNHKNYSYQEEILNSFLLLPIAADKLNEVIVKNYTAVSELKKGLCLQWVQTEVCNSENCAWSHEPRGLFEKRLHPLPNSELINILLCMQDDQFYLEALLEGFEELIKRDVPERWIHILIFYIFTKTESLFFNFFEFWCKIAEYFCIKRNVDDTTLGFIELLSLFSNVKREDRWKVFRFFEMLKSSSSKIKISYQLLKPILSFHISPKLFIEAVESCCESKVDVQQVHKEIVGKIDVQYLPLNGVETLLKYAELVNSSYSTIIAENLRKNLASKVLNLPSNIDGKEYPLTAKYYRTLSGVVDKDEDETIYEELITNILQEHTETFDFQHFSLKLNEINENFVERASETITTAVFSMKLSTRDIMDLLDITIFNVKTKSAKQITASLAITLIHDYVKKDDWKTACSILEICDNKKINMLHSKIIGSDPKNVVEEYKLVFLLAEIYLNNEKWEEFIFHLEKYYILSPEFINWAVQQKPECRKLKAQVIDQFFKMTFSRDLIDEPYALFKKISKCQRELGWPIDLRYYANDIIVGLINTKNTEAISLGKEVWPHCLKPTAFRSWLIYLVQEKLIEDAEKYFAEVAGKIYNFPKDMLPDADPIFKVTVESTWSEEELFLFFSYYFYKLMRFNFKPSRLKSVSPHSLKLNISIQVSSLEHDLEVKLWSLMEIDNSADAVKKRLQSVLENKMVPPLKTFSFSKVIFVEGESLYQHLHSVFSKFKTI